jgi:hypothetical protein
MMTITATEKYEERKATVDLYLSMISEMVENHKPEAVTWGHVGDLGIVETGLEQVIDFLTGSSHPGD